MSSTLKILVTGGGGYLGFPLSILLSKNAQNHIYIPIKNTSKYFNINQSNITFLQLDLLDSAALKHFFQMNKIDFVIHLAGNTKDRDNQIKQAQNVAITENLLNMMYRFNINKLIYTSSSAIYGSPKYLPINTEHPATPLTPYGISKARCEHIIKCYSKKYCLDYLTLRIFNVYGTSEYTQHLSQPNIKPGYLIPVVINKLTQNLPIYLHGNHYPTKDGTPIRDYIHIDDVLSAINKAFKHILNVAKTNKAPTTLNLGTGVGISVKEIIDMTSKVLKATPKLIIKKPLYSSAHSLVADIKTTIDYLDWQPMQSLTSNIHTINLSKKNT